MIYLIGSLRNPEVPKIANRLRTDLGIGVFDDWYAAGPEADDKWREYEIGRGRSYREALNGKAARNVFEFDKRNLDRAAGVVLSLPAGKSGHLELGYCLGKGIPGYILLDSPDRWDVMYQFATGVFDKIEDLEEAIVLSNPQGYLTYKWNQYCRSTAKVPTEIRSSSRLHAAFEANLVGLQRYTIVPGGARQLAFKSTRYGWQEDLKGIEVMMW
jgi:hypothetical protein